MNVRCVHGREDPVGRAVLRIRHVQRRVHYDTRAARLFEYYASRSIKGQEMPE